ncbi:MAG: alpha/beta hydrolase [Bacteroidota bacterium]
MLNNSNKIHVYFIPGLATGIHIFEHIKLPENTFEIHFLEWLIPKTYNESIVHYAKRMSDNVIHQNSILVGVSFGGILAQEISKIIPIKKVILISSIKHHNEMPKRLNWILKTHFYKLFPSKTLASFNKDSKYAINDNLKRKAKLIDKYLQVRDEKYLNWAIFNVLNWQQNKYLRNTIHIHGSDDIIFPIKYIQNCIVIEGGTHEMILTKSKTINNILQEVILKNED